MTDRVPFLVTAIAVALVVFSLVSSLVLNHFITVAPEKLVQQGVRLVLTCALAFFLWRGAAWARTWTIILASLGSVLGLVLLATLPPMGMMVLPGLLCVTVVFYSGVACLLVFSTTVKTYFKPPQGDAEQVELEAWPADADESCT